MIQWTHFIVALLLLVCSATAVPAWPDNGNNVIVNSNNKAGKIDISNALGDKSSLLIEFDLASDDSKFNLQIIPLFFDKDSGNATGLFAYDFQTLKKEVETAITSVKITYQYPSGLTNLVPKSVFFMMFKDNEGWESIGGKTEDLTMVTYTISKELFSHSFPLGVFCNKLPSVGELGSSIQIDGPRLVKIGGTVNGSLEFETRELPTNNSAFITFTQENLETIVSDLPSALNPLVSFKYSTKGAMSNIFSISFTFLKDVKSEIPSLQCTCSTSSSDIIFLEMSPSNENKYKCSGDMSPCIRITISAPIPLSLTPGKIVGLSKYSKKTPFAFIMFQNLDPKELYTLQVIGSMQVSVKRMNKEGNTGFIVLPPVSNFPLMDPLSHFLFISTQQQDILWGDISLSTGRIEISQQEYDFLKNETLSQQVQTTALSVSMGISALLNLGLIVVVCALAIVMCMKKKRYAELNRN